MHEKHIEKMKKNSITNFYINEITTILLNYFYFVYDDEITFDYKHAIQFSLMNGLTCITKEKNKLKAWAFVNGTGRLDENGEYTEFNVSDFTGETKNLKVGENCVIMKNGFLHNPESNILHTAEILTEIDVSQLATVVNSRLAPIFSANNESTAKRIKEVYNSIKDGKFDTVVSNNINHQIDLSDIFNNDVSKDIQKIELFDVNNIQTIQYLTEFYNTRKSRLYTYYGLNTNMSNKHAQMNESELNTFELPALIQITDKLNCMYEFCDDIKNLFDINIDVELTEIFKTAYDNTIKKLQNEVKTNEKNNSEN